METSLPLPQTRCLSKEQAAADLGIGLTLLAELNIPSIKLGKRCLYDVLDLDAWLEEYKQRGRAGKEYIWPEKKDSTRDPTPVSGGSTLSFPVGNAYEQALGLKAARKRKP
jgi:hypothetical protein